LTPRLFAHISVRSLKILRATMEFCEDIWNSGYFYYGSSR
jgi:hypothetical protein